MNNLTTTSPLYLAMQEFLTRYEGGFYACFSEDDIVDTRESIESFAIGRRQNIMHDEVVDGVRFVHAIYKSSNPQIKGLEAMLFATDGQWTLVVTV